MACTYYLYTICFSLKIDGRTILYYIRDVPTYYIIILCRVHDWNRLINLCVRRAVSQAKTSFSHRCHRYEPTDMVVVATASATTADVNNPLNFFADTNVRIIINRKCVYSGSQKATVILFERMSSPRTVAAPTSLPDVATAAAEYTLITFNANTIATV